MSKVFSIPVKALLLIIMSGTFQAAYACDAKCEKKVAKKVASYEKAIVKIETKDCKDKSSLKTTEKFCSKALKSLDKRYDRYKDFVKQHNNIAPLRNRHDQLNEKLAGIREQIEIKEVTNTFDQALYNMAINCTTKGEQNYCLKRADVALSEYENFPSEIKDSKTVKNKMKEIKQLLAKNKELENEAKGDKKKFKASIAASELYTDLHRKTYKVIEMLRKGKNNTGDTSLSQLGNIQKLSNEIDEFKKNCEGSFKLSKSKVKEIKDECELMGNFDKYLTRYKTNTGKLYLDGFINSRSKTVSRLKGTGKIYSGLYSDFLNFENDKKQMIQETPFVDFPTKQFDDLHDAFEDALEVAFKKNDWDDFVDEEMHDGFEPSAEKGYAQRENLKLIKGGYAKKSDWGVYKNGLGIIINKYRSGYLLFKKSGESNYRMYPVTFHRDYEGATGYADASSLKINYQDMMPVED
jgi:hypothetical protein